MRQTKVFLISLALFAAVFVFCCGILIAKSGLFINETSDRCILLRNAQDDKNVSESEFGIKIIKSKNEPNEPPKNAEANLIVIGGKEEIVSIGAKDPCTEDPQKGFKFQLELNALGASIQKVTFSDGKGEGFDDLDYKNPKPLVLLKPFKYGDKDIVTMANDNFSLFSRNAACKLDKLPWQYLGSTDNNDGSITAAFRSTLVENMLPILKITKTYSIRPNDYVIDCSIYIENSSSSEQTYSFGIEGPAGIGNEGFRGDSRRVIGCFVNTKEEHTTVIKTADALRKDALKSTTGDTKIDSNEGDFLWLAITNKYFASILVPQPSDKNKFCDWIKSKTGAYIDPDGRPNSGDETIATHLVITKTTLKSDETREYKFQLYCGPKDNMLFNKNPQFKSLGFINAIDFMPCFCCPAMLIRPLAFGILRLMEWLHVFLFNYGLVIIILVFVVRLILHPLTKKGQVSMSKMSKLAPKVEQLKKKYADNKAEMNKQVMALYKEQGASPITGMIPMFIQMPIWIALYSAIDASVSLRGAKFLPFWITNLSAPDALFHFPAVQIPLLGKFDSFNLLPILMGLAFYLQQKLTPTQAAAGNTQMAQQQKIMMIMMPILFPLMLYSAPSGLNLYIMASTFAGAIEQYVIKKHIKEREKKEDDGLVPVTSKTGGKVKKKKPKPFFKNFT
jgi:YidC/Oxa1 family membrane protein insertase